VVIDGGNIPRSSPLYNIQPSISLHSISNSIGDRWPCRTTSYQRGVYRASRQQRKDLTARHQGVDKRRSQTAMRLKVAY